MKTLLGLLVLASLVALPVAAQNNTGISVPVTGKLLDATQQQVGTFTGNFNIQRFALQNGQLVAVGTLRGTATNTATGLVSAIVGAVTGVVTNSQGSCTILDLSIGAIDLNLLGLRVQTDPINLLITAEQGPGNLLGNLLCSIANLLNNPSQQLVALLNNLLRVLGNL